MGPARISYVLLYRTEQCWRITVGEAEPEGIACGPLPDVAASDSADRAKVEFCKPVKRYWGTDISPEALQPLNGRTDWFGLNVSSDERLEDLAEA